MEPETITEPVRFVLRVAANSHIGQVRETNEDAHVVAMLGTADVSSTDSAQDEVFDPYIKPVLLAIADGMGGHEAGELASALAIESLRRALPPDSPDWKSTLRDAVEAANREVWTAGQAPSHLGMGSTLTAVCVHGADAYVAEVGDSRAYLLRDGQLRLLTHDQSYVQMLIDMGELTPEQGEHSLMKNVLLSAIGQGESVKVDLGCIRLQLEDTLLVCCDGLSNEVAADEIREVLSRHYLPSVACATLIRMANDHGGRDNITVVVAVAEPAA